MRERGAFLAILYAVATLATSAQAVALELTEVIKKVEVAVVRIDTDAGLGSGVIIDDRGFVATNFHVIDGSRTATVILKDGRTLPCRGYVAADPTYDVAILKVELPQGNPRAIRFAGAKPTIGERLAALGNPKGFSFSVSEGIASAVRSGKEVADAVGIDAYRFQGYALDATWVQTTAPISPGNSGGPLVNMNAELVGLNTFTHTKGQNLNFAISVDDVVKIFAKGVKAPPQDLASLPRPRGIPVDPNPGQDKAKSFKLEFPTGRVFSFEVFRTEAPATRRASTAGEGEIRDGIVVLRHTNGSVYASAGQVKGILHGDTIAQWDNREPMVYAAYNEGRRHGILKTWNEAGKPVYFAQFAKGKLNGFLAFFDSGELRLIGEYVNGEAQYIQLMMNDKALEGFTSEDEAKKNDNAALLLEKLDAVEEKIKKNEALFKRQVKEMDRRIRNAYNARVAVATRNQLIADINRENAANAAFHIENLRRALGGR